MTKQITLSGRKRTHELVSMRSPTATAVTAKKEQLSQLRAEVEVQEPSPPLATVPLKLEEILEQLEGYSQVLQTAGTPQHRTYSLQQQKEMLTRQVSHFVNHRAQLLERKGVSGKAKKMQCEALLYSLLEGLRNRNIHLSKLRLVEKY